MLALNEYHVGDCRRLLRRIPGGSVQTCVTSPPYYYQRDYNMPGQIGLERSPAQYVRALVGVFRGVRRALARSGTLWLNVGDTYCTNSRGAHTQGYRITGQKARTTPRIGTPEGLKRKDLIGIPWMLALALRDDGWYLRSDIIWRKSNAMPSSTRDRPTTEHEYVFLLSKSERYYYDWEAISEPIAEKTLTLRTMPTREEGTHELGPAGAVRRDSRGSRMNRWMARNGGRYHPERRNARSVWDIATEAYEGEHSSTFPRELVRRCLLASSRPGDAVLDPFAGSGTVGVVAEQHARRWLLLDLNPAYAAEAALRLRQRSLLNQV